MAKIKFRRDTAAAWTQANPVLAQGEPGFEHNTGKFKIGDGVTAWTSLAYSAAGSGDSLTSESIIQVQTGDADRWLVRLRQEDDTVNPYPNQGVVVYNTSYDSEGNALVLAQVELNSPDSIAVFKFTSAGELIWKTILNTGNTYYNQGSAAVTPEDDLVFCLNQDSPNLVIVKINGETGAIVFSREVDVGGDYGYAIRSVTVDSSGNIVIAGYDNTTTNNRGIVIKLSSTAETILWQTSTSVDIDDTQFYAVVVDFNNDVVVTGTTAVATPGGVSESEEVIVVAKFAGTTGQLVWQKTVALAEVRYSGGFGLSLDSVGNIYVCGVLLVANPESTLPWDNKNSNAVVVFKMTALGAMVWDRRIGPGPCDWVGVSTAVGDDGDLYMYAATYQRRVDAGVDSNNGEYDSTLALARYNKTTGDVIWQRYFNNPNAQELPGFDNSGPWAWGSGNTLDVFEDRIIIGGSVRLGPSGPDQWSNQTTNRYFTQGFIAQFDTAATKFSVDGWTLEPSRIPGKLTNKLIATAGPMEDGALNKTVGGTVTITTKNTGVSVSRRASKTNIWTFGKDGTFTAPADTDIKLQQSQLGYANMYGIWPNDTDSIYFHSVTHDTDGFAYVIGGDSWGAGFAHIYKFTPEGEMVWQRQLRSGSGASFNVVYDTNVYTEVTVSSGGDGYKVGDKIVLEGGTLGGTSGINELTLTVATLGSSTSGVGSVGTVTIESGIANGTGSASGIGDFYDNARCDVQSMTFDPVTGNPVVVISIPTFNGDTLDTEWTETVVLLIDSGSGVVLSSTTLSDEGDIYPNDVAVSVTGKVAVVGEKYGEYAEYGSITALAGSGVDKLWVAKSDIDADHYPGEPNGSYSDWWITGTGITDKIQVQNVNYYTGLTGTITRPGSGLVVDVTINLGNYTIVDASSSPGLNYVSGQKFKITGDLLGGTTPANDLIFTVGVGGGGDVILASIISGTAGGPDQVYSTITPVKVNGNGADFNYWFDAATGSIINSGIWGNVGQDYLAGDQIVIPGTQFAGGTSPANDITVTVSSVGGSGDLQNPLTFTGTPALTHVLLNTNASVDFAANGASFAIKQNLGGEAFIWTPDFSKAMGSGNTDFFSGVVWNALGTSLYAVGTGRYETTYDQALVTKWSSTGTLQASVSINTNQSSNNASYGAVALMADDCIVTVHTMYNDVRNQTTEVLVTKLDSNLAIVWQQFIAAWNDNGGWDSPDGQPTVAVDPATDEILVVWEATQNDVLGDDGIYIVKLDTDGDVVWKRGFGVYESDTQIRNNSKYVSIYGGKFAVVGRTDAPNDDTDNAMIFTMPMDGTGLGQHGIWIYREPNDDQIKVMRVPRESDGFNPNVNSGTVTAAANVKYYYTDYPQEEFDLFREVVRSEVGGAVEFADGSRQSFSTAIIPQIKISAGRYTIQAEDSGRHILIETSDYAVIIPNYRDVTLPVGFTFTIVNVSSSTAYVENQSVNSGEQGQMWFSGGNDKTPYVSINDNGSGQMVTLIKIKEGTYSDDGAQHGDIWMIAGADISNNN